MKIICSCIRIIVEEDAFNVETCKSTFCWTRTRARKKQNLKTRAQTRTRKQRNFWVQARTRIFWFRIGTRSGLDPDPIGSRPGIFKPKSSTFVSVNIYTNWGKAYILIIYQILWENCLGKLVSCCLVFYHWVLNK
jgi:hypothetical protein